MGAAKELLKTPLQYQIESAVTSGTGYFDTEYQDHLKRAKAVLTHEDDTDVQFSLLHRGAQNASFQGFEELSFELSRHCGDVIKLRGRLATTDECPIYLRTPEEVWETIRVIKESQARNKSLLDFQLLNHIFDFRKDPTHLIPQKRDSLSSAQIRILQITEDSISNAPITNIHKISGPDLLIQVYLEGIGPEIIYKEAC